MEKFTKVNNDFIICHIETDWSDLNRNVEYIQLDLFDKKEISICYNSNINVNELFPEHEILLAIFDRKTKKLTHEMTINCTIKRRTKYKMVYKIKHLNINC